MTWGDSESADGGSEKSSGMAKYVVGIGNLLSSDEGVGCHVAQALQEISLPDVEVIDGGTCPDALGLIEDADKLVIVDAARGGGMPGQIYRFHPDDITPEQKPLLSAHDMSLLDSLMLVKAWREVSETVVIGVEPKELGWGLELSPEVRAGMPQIIDAVLFEVNNTSPKGEVKC
jgi:hydrogenase maturation protease